MMAFCVYIKIFPVISSAGDFKSLFLPALTLAIAMFSKYTRQVRTAVLDELSQDYVIGAEARGEKRSRIIWCNVFPNSLLPLITMFGLSIGSLLGVNHSCRSYFLLSRTWKPCSICTHLARHAT